MLYVILQNYVPSPERRSKDVRIDVKQYSNGCQTMFKRMSNDGQMNMKRRSNEAKAMLK